MKNIKGNLLFEHQPQIVSGASVVGKKEGEGPLREYFDRIIHDSYAGMNTFEQAESRMMSKAVQLAMDKGRYSPAEIDLACCGDLLNQCVASSFAMRRFSIPYSGVYGACSTMALSMIMAAIAVESGAVRRAVCAASSHYCTAERQYRFPLEYGSQRPPTAQWTVTGAGACIIDDVCCRDLLRDTADIKNERCRLNADTEKGLSKTGVNAGGEASADRKAETETLHRNNRFDVPTLYAARLGKIIDYNITDQNNMGAAMAPAIVKIGT